MILYHRVLGLTLALWLQAPDAGTEAPIPLPERTDQAAQLSLKEIRSGIRSYYDRLWAIHVVYHIVPVGGSRGLQVPAHTQRFAFKGEKRMVGWEYPESAQEREHETKRLLPVDSLRVYDGQFRYSLQFRRRRGRRYDEGVVMRPKPGKEPLDYADQ